MNKTYFVPTLTYLLSGPGRPFIHRDLSWLQFNSRVLDEARAASNPLLERVKFLAITASNLDEFFMIRFASLGRSIAAASRRRAGETRHLARVRNAILDRVTGFTARQAETLDLLAAELEDKGVRLVLQSLRDDPAFEAGRRIFEKHVLPALPPPEPFSPVRLSALENLQKAAIFPNGMWLRVPRSLPRIFRSADAPDEISAFFLDELLLSHLAAAFRLPEGPGLIRLTRDGDISVDLEEEDPASIPDIIRTGLGTREKGRPVRLQYAGEMPAGFLNRCQAHFRFSAGQICPAPHTLSLHGLWTLANQLPDPVRSRPGMSLPPFRSLIPQPFREGQDIFAQLRRRDLLLHHPYDSFEAYVRWIQAACDDPAVTMIQQTVYRMDALSPVMDALKAAGKKKKIRVVIELRARFDELNNLRLADELRKAGIEVAFGFGKLKLHAKVALVTRKEEGKSRYYTHLSTGNYNATTARLYEDMAILTANQEFGEDASLFFDAVCAGKVPTGFRHLAPAPSQLHRLLLGLIKREIEAAREGKAARIVAKMNALVDEQIIETLYEASRAGVQVDLIVRGACSLIPGVRSLSENIRVTSVVDRFLEHSRIYHFTASNAMYLSSADWMPRNFFSRLELAFPVLDPRIYRYIQEVVIPVYLADTVKERELTPQGTWKRRTASSLPWRVRQANPFAKQPVRAQFFFEELARQEYRGTPLGPAVPEKKDAPA